MRTKQNNKIWGNSMKKSIIRKYFQAWLDADILPIEDIFSQDIFYSECYGPEYHGMKQMLQWFRDWNRNGKVLEWSIKRIVEQDNTLVAEWYFECGYNGEKSGFDGVTVAEFNEEMKISRLLEFQSKHEHYHPYE
jgi:hypothetical protein